MSIKINYNANTIASISNGEKTTLACKGKLMADNVCVDATENGESDIEIYDGTVTVRQRGD